MFAWLVYKRFAIRYVMIILLLGCGSYIYFDLSIPVPVEDSTITEIIWTDHYKVNGQSIRGFARGNDGNKWYVQLKIQSEQEKVTILNQSLAGSRFAIIALPVPEKPRAHEFAFDMESYIKSNGAVGQVLVEQYRQLSPEQSFATYMAQKRFQMKKHIQATFPKSLQAEAEALLIGSREQMSSELQNAYQTLGITHLFAISGLHVALIAFLIYQLMIRLQVRKETANWVLLIALPLYAFLAGGAPSVWRSVSVTEIVLISRLFKEKLAVDDAFSISVIGFIWLSPWVIFQIGFQLSYLAAFSLIYSSVFLTNQLSSLKQSFVITAVCQLIVFPILLYQFYEVSISSSLANLIFVPLFSFFILPVNILFLMLTFVSTYVSDLLFSVYEPLRILLDQFILYCGSLPFQLWNPMKPSLLLVIISYVGVFTFFIFAEKKKPLIVSSGVLLVSIFLIQVTPYLNSSTKITFLNVGQGDCILIEMPYRKEILMIDTGGLLRFEQTPWKASEEVYEIGREVVVPFLKGKGISTIDTLIITHADADHMEGAEEILQEVRVKEIHVSPKAHEEGLMVEVKAEAMKQQIPIIEKMGGEQIQSSYFSLQYLYPLDMEYEGNNDSLVLSMQNQYFHGLFLGDLEKEGEEELIKNYSTYLKGIDVLKIGHHGSKTSSTEPLLKLTNPRFSVISAGYDNRYGHPHKEVVERLETLRLPYLQTGEVGTIQVEIKKKGEVLVTTP